MQSCVQAEIYIISYQLPVPQAAIFHFSHTLTSSYTNIRPIMLFDTKDMRIPLKFHKYFICNVGFKWFRFHVRHFDFQLNSHRIVHRAQANLAISNGHFGILKNKRSNVEFNQKDDLRPLMQWSPSLSHFHQKIIRTIFTSGDVIR